MLCYSAVDSLGGDAFWAAGISLFTPLPYLVDKPLRGHLFINAGGLGAMQNGESKRCNTD
jgi:outer membrane protein insertion porin family